VKEDRYACGVLAESTDKKKIFGRPMHNGKIRLK